MDTYKAVAAPVAVTAGVPKTILQVETPSTQRVKFVSVAVSFNGASTAVAKVDLVRQASDGTSGGSVTPAPLDPSAPASLCSVATSWSAEPTTTTTIESWYVSQNGAVFVIPFNPGEEPQLDISSHMGLVVTAGGDSDCIASVTYLE